jgi:hypothetical protein
MTGVTGVDAASFYETTLYWMEENFDAISFDIETRHPSRRPSTFAEAFDASR